MSTIAAAQLLKFARYVKEGKATFPQKFVPVSNERKQIFAKKIGRKWKTLIRTGEAHIDHGGQSLKIAQQSTGNNTETNLEKLAKTGTAHKNYGWEE